MIEELGRWASRIGRRDALAALAAKKRFHNRNHGPQAGRLNGWLCTRRVLAGLGVWLVAFNVFAKEEAVTVTKGEVKVEYKRFDPKKMPEPPPPLGVGETAVCEYWFGVDVDLDYVPAGPAATEKGKVKREVKVTRVGVTLNLTVTVWLATDASKALAAHEEGHRQIAEAYYKDAEGAGRAAGEGQVGKVVSGEGADADAAGKDVVDKVVRRVCEDYVVRVVTPCDKAHAAYDRLTDHGRKERPGVGEAVKVAVEEGKGKK